jgi:CIC family chloride channel protein
VNGPRAHADIAAGAEASASGAEATAEITRREVREELREYARRQERRRHLLPRAVLVGAIAGLLAVLFRRTLEWGESASGRLIGFAHHLGGWGVLLPIAVGALGAGIAVWLVRRYAPEASGSGIPHVKAVLHHLHGLRWRRVLPVKFASGAVGIGAGLALGREGPTVQMGAAVGQMVAGWVRGSPRERQTLIAAGAGAGLAAAFNAPLAGVIFVLEELRRDFAPGTLTAAFVASVTADVITRLLLGQLAVFHTAPIAVPPLAALPLFAALGLICGLGGVIFNRSLLGSLRLMDLWRERPFALGASVGALVGAVAWFAPSAVGGGNALVERMIAGTLTLGVLLPLLLLRFGLTMASYGSGAAGGIFAPLLVIGAQTGLLFALCAMRLLPLPAVHATAFAVVGMAAFFAAIVRAPLTGIVLIVEMTESYALMLPLIVTCFLAYLTAEALRDEPIYEALLERELSRTAARPELETATLVDDLLVAETSFASGRSVAELGLAPGLLIVSIARGARVEVPLRDTVLMPGDRLTVAVAPQAAGELHVLRRRLEGS